VSKNISLYLTRILVLDVRSLLIATPGLLDWSKRVQANFSQTALKEHELTEIWALTVAMWKEELKKVCVYI
jgi:hypothetical protein